MCCAPRATARSPSCTPSPAKACASIRRSSSSRRLGRRRSQEDQMTAADLALFLIGTFVAAFVSGLSGFAYALVSLAFWIWLFPLAELTPLVLFGAVVSQAVAVPSVWRTVDWPTLWPMLGASLVFLPLGVWLIAHIDLDLFRLSFGLLL